MPQDAIKDNCDSANQDQGYGTLYWKIKIGQLGNSFIDAIDLKRSLCQGMTLMLKIARSNSDTAEIEVFHQKELPEGIKTNLQLVNCQLITETMEIYDL